MATHPITKNYPVGKSARVVMSTVREDMVPYNTDNAARLYQFWREIVATQPDYEQDKESLIVVLLTTRLRPYAWHRVSLGTLNEASAHPREIMRPVITGGAYAFAMMHNHPSGDTYPSDADVKITKRIKECGTLFAIRLLDHVIVSDCCDSYYSLAEHGIL